MSISNIKAGRAYIEIAADSSRLKRDLTAAQTHLRDFASRIQGLTSVATAAFASLSSIAVLGIAKHFAESGDAIQKMSQRTGVSAEALSELAYAAKLSDVSIDTLGTGLRKMQIFMIKAAEGGKAENEALQKLGLNLSKLGKLSPDQQFSAFAEAIGSIDDPAVRATRAMDVFSKAGSELIPLLLEQADGIAKLRTEARDLGITMSGEDANKAAAFGDALDRLRMTMTGLFNKIGAAVAPLFSRLSDYISFATAWVGKFLDKNRKWVALIAPLVSALGAATAATIGIAVATKLLWLAMGPTILAVGGFAIALGGTAISALIAAAPLAIALAAAVGGLTATMYGFGITWNDVAAGIASAWSASMAFIGNSLNPITSRIARFVSTVVDAFAWMYSGAKQYFGAIGKALSDGNLEGAGAVAMAGLKQVFRLGFNQIYGFWLAVTEGFATAWDGATFDLSKGMVSSMASLESVFVDTTSFLTQAWDAFVYGLKATWNTTIGFIQKAWIQLKALFDKDINVQAEVDTINKRTEQENVKSTSDLVGRVAGRERERQDKQKQIEADRQFQVNDLDRTRDGRRKNRKAETDKAASEAQAELDKAKADYAAALKKVEKFKPDFGSKKSNFGFDPEELSADKLDPEKIKREVAKSESRGTFNAAAIAGLSSDSVAKSTEATAKNTAKILDVLKNNGGLNFA